MKSYWLTFSEDSPTKRVFYQILFIDSMLVTLAMFGAVATGHPPDLHFREEGFLTYVSCLQLVIAAVIAGKIFNLVKGSSSQELVKLKTFWLVICLGLTFLALDDGFEIHEEIDFLLHDLLNITQNTLTDLLDDLIVGGYILLSLLYFAFKRQQIHLFRRSLVFFQAGCVLTGIMVILDVASHNYYLASLVVDRAADREVFKQWLGAWEDGAKIYAEGMFIMTVYKCRQIVKSIDARAAVNKEQL
ncbi:MAG: hypothetical protein AAGE96_23995 [Cyanobacteria bacterium P01_G01_bin.19]